MSRIDRVVIGINVDDFFICGRRVRVKVIDLFLIVSRDGENCVFGNKLGGKDVKCIFGLFRGFI